MLASTPTLAQGEDDAALSAEDSTALSLALSVADAYVDHLDRYFNRGEAMSDELREGFMVLFTGSQKIISDYSAQTRRIEPAEYLFEAGQIFADERPALQAQIDREGAVVKHFPNDRFHLAAIPLDTRFSRYFDLSTGAVVNDTIEKFLTLEVRITGIENARIDRSVERAPVLYYAEQRALLAQAEQERDKRRKEENEKKSDAPRERRAKPERMKADMHSYIFAGFVLGGDLSSNQLESQSELYSFSNHSFQMNETSIQYFMPLHRSGLYLHTGFGISVGRLDLEYNNASFSFEQVDNLNPSSDVQFAEAGIVNSYQRTAILEDISERIDFTDINFRLGLGIDLLSDSRELFMFSAGMMLGVTNAQKSDVMLTANYHGHFSEVNGLPIDLTLGVNEDLPEYGFDERRSLMDFVIDRRLIYSAYAQVAFAKHIGDKVYVGIQLEGRLPMNQWLEGGADHELLFGNHGDLDSSLADLVSDIRRPYFLGGGVLLGMKF